MKIMGIYDGADEIDDYDDLKEALTVVLEDNIEKAQIEPAKQMWQDILKQVSDIKEDENGLKFLQTNLANFYDGYHIMGFESVIEVDDQTIAIAEIFLPGTYPEEFRAKNYNVFDLTNKKEAVYQFAEYFDEPGKIEDMLWTKKNHLGNDEWDSWQAVDVATDDKEKAICTAIVNIDNRKLVQTMEGIKDKLLLDDGPKVIEEATTGEKYSVKQFCGAMIEMSLSDIESMYYGVDVLRSNIQHEIKPLMNIVNKIDAGKDLTFHELKLLEEFDVLYGGKVGTYKDTNIKTLNEDNFDILTNEFDCKELIEKYCEISDLIVSDDTGKIAVWETSKEDDNTFTYEDYEEMVSDYADEIKSMVDNGALKLNNNEEKALNHAMLSNELQKIDDVPTKKAAIVEKPSGLNKLDELKDLVANVEDATKKIKRIIAETEGR